MATATSSSPAFALPTNLDGLSSSKLAVLTVYTRAALVATDYKAWLAGSSARFLIHLNPPATKCFRVSCNAKSIVPSETIADLDAASREHLQLGLDLLGEYEIVIGGEVYIANILLDSSVTDTFLAEHRFFAARYPDPHRCGITLAVISTPHCTGPDHKTDIHRYTYNQYWVLPYWLHLPPQPLVLKQHGGMEPLAVAAAQTLMRHKEGVN